MAASCISLALSSGALAAVSTRSECAFAKRPAVTAIAALGPEAAPLAVSPARMVQVFPAQRRASRCAAFASSSDLEQDLYGGSSLPQESLYGGSSGASQDSLYGGRQDDLYGSGGLPLPGPPPNPQEGSKLYVGNLPWNVDSRTLSEIFQDVGTVELVEVIYDRDTGRSRGFAFVTMASNEDAVKAIERLDGYEIESRPLRVNFPQPGGGRAFGGPRPPRSDFGGGPRVGGFGYNTPNKLFVGNLAWGVDDIGLEQLFSEYGKVIEARVILDRATGKSKGFGFVTLSSEAEVSEAIGQLDGHTFDGRQLRVNLAGDKPAPRMEY